MKSIIAQQLAGHHEVSALVRDTLADDIAAACRLALETLESGHKLLLFGNGGSAADAQHIAAELTGRYKIERRGLPVIALSTDTSALTAIGNDLGFEEIFARQVEALAVAGDLLIGISTSGNSANVNRALEFGRKTGCKTLALTGRDGGAMRALADVCLIVPSDDTPRIQEMHILIGHTICHVVEAEMFPAPGTD